MKSKGRLERFYKRRDPWGYETNPDDKIRKGLILAAIPGKFKRALDLGAGEGWITQDLPAEDIYGYDLSDKAMKRFPENVIQITPEEMTCSFDLIIATGVLYKQYDYLWFIRKINELASGTVILCNIESWEKGTQYLEGEQKHELDFQYRKFTEKLRVYDYTAIAQHREPRPCQL